MFRRRVYCNIKCDMIANKTTLNMRSNDIEIDNYASSGVTSLNKTISILKLK